MRRGDLALVAGLALAVPGCTARGGPPPIAADTPCSACGMEARDPHFACERERDKRWRVYDSIECLLREAGPAAASGAIYLADYDRASLHAADSMWVVRGEFASPMGGGYAAFLDHAAADSIATRTRGRVGRLGAFAEPGAGS